MADDRDSLLREVDEELRREQMQKLWERYSGLILGVAVLIVAGVGGYKFYEGRRIADAEAAGAEFAVASDLSTQSKADDATKAFEKIAASGSGGYTGLAKLHLAGAQAKAGKTAEAVATYESLAKDGGSDELLKSFAQLQAANLRLGEGDYTEMQNRLTPLATDSSPFKISARELLGLAAFKGGKLDEARKQLEPLLIDPAASAAIQERIKIVMAQITASETSAAAPASAATAPPGATAPASPAPQTPPAAAEPEKK